MSFFCRSSLGFQKLVCLEDALRQELHGSLNRSKNADCFECIREESRLSASFYRRFCPQLLPELL